MTPSYPIFPIYPIFILPYQKKEEGGGTIFIHLKMYEIYFSLFVCSQLEHFDVFKMLLLLFPMFDMVFCKDFPIFITKQNTMQAIGSILPTKIANSCKLFKLNKAKGLRIVWEVKIFGWFTHIAYKRTHFRISCVWHGFMLHTI